MVDIKVKIKEGDKIKVYLNPPQGVKIDLSNKYLWDPNVAQGFIDLTESYKNQAKDSADSAEEYKNQAMNYADDAMDYASQSESSANASEEAKDISVSAKNEATAQAVIATNASNNAVTQANIATTKAGESQTYANNAHDSELNAKTSEDNAKASELESQRIETSVQGYTTQAMNYADDAMDYASQAESSAQASEEAKDLSISAKNEATSQATIATNASNNAVSQANIATSKAGEAETYSNNARQSELNAKSSEQNASTYADNALVSANNAHTSELNAQAVLERLGTVIKIKGRVSRIEDLPTTGNLDGDTYLVGVDGLDSYPEYYWYSNHWEFLGTSAVSLEWGGITGTLSNQTDLQTALDSKQPTGNYVTTDTRQTITGEKTFNNNVVVDLGSVASRSLKVKGSGGDQAFLLERTSGATCVLEAGNSIGLFGTKTEHPIQIRTAYTNRMTIGTDGSVTLATAPISTSNNNQLATTKWVNDKGYITSSYHDSTKQDTLTSGTNIKTVNNTSLLGSGNIEIKSAPDLDNVSISKNSSDALQTIAVIDNNSNAIKTWTGTKEQYDAITTKDNNTLYNITDDTDTGTDILQMIYPVGSLYLTTNATCPLANLFGTWTLVSQDRVLQGAGSRGSVGTTLQESLPNIRGSVSFGGGASYGWVNHKSGALSNSDISGNSNPFTTASGTVLQADTDIKFDASRSSSTYQDNAPVQQNAYLINVFRRTA